MITPTVGRVVWFYSAGQTAVDLGHQPYAALIAYVHSDRLINIAYFDHNGVPGQRTSMKLRQDGDELDYPAQPHCCWMPYQIGQAKKHDAEHASAASAAQYKGG